jgi:hypothetical protein
MRAENYTSFEVHVVTNKSRHSDGLRAVRPGFDLR